MSERPGVGYFIIFSVERFDMRQKMDPIGLKVCKNDGSIRSKINEKGGQLDWKLRQKVMQNGENWCKILKTKCDRHKLIFAAERAGQSDLVASYNRDQMGSTISKMGVIMAEPSYHA